MEEVKDFGCAKKPIENPRDKVFKNGPSKICGSCLSRTYHFKFFKGCLPQILLGTFLNTLSHIQVLQFALYCTVNRHLQLENLFLFFYYSVLV